MRILFMGTPDFAAVSLKRLVEDGHEICGVFTQPDKPRNRNKVTFSPVKEYALSCGLTVYQPVKMRDGTALDIVKSLAPELIVVVAYGRILPKDILDVPPLGCVNVHASLLPKYRGAAPINWAILNGEKETGVTIMYMAQGLDTGDIISQESTLIGNQEDATVLFARLAELGAGLLVRTLEQIKQGTASRTAQDDSHSSYAPMLSKEMSPMDWDRSAQQLHDQVRGLVPWPSATTVIDGVRCKVWSTTLTGERTEKSPGSVVQADKRGLKLACGDGQVLQIDELQPDGKKRMAAAAFLLGHPIAVD